MTLRFDFGSVATIEFGVGREDGRTEHYFFVPVDAKVQTALREMAQATWAAMGQGHTEPRTYEPSEKYASLEYLLLSLDHEFAARLRTLHDAQNLPTNADALGDAVGVFCYFARMVDAQGQNLTALRRATTFKGVLKSRLIKLSTDALQIIEDKVFKLDADFDILIDNSAIHILRPSGFEFAGKLQDAILAAVPQNASTLQSELPFVDFAPIQDYASSHPRAARYLASIRSQNATANVSRAALGELCNRTGVEFNEVDGKIVVPQSETLAFLEVLDRRRYHLELVEGSPERFRAASRSKIALPGA